MSKKLYHVGLNPDAPMECLHLAGVEFPKRSERVEGFGAQTKRTDVQGTYLELSDAKVEAIKKASAMKFFRMKFDGDAHPGRNGKKNLSRYVLMTKEGSGFLPGGQATKPYVPQAGDIDAGRFIYLKPAETNPVKGHVTYEPLLGAPGLSAPEAADDEDESDAPKRGRGRGSR